MYCIPQGDLEQALSLSFSVLQARCIPKENERVAAENKRGIDVLIGDPGRNYLPKDKLTSIATYAVPVTRDLEDAEIKKTSVWRLSPNC